MQAELHPKYRMVNVKCSCGHQFQILSQADLHLDVCNECHPFYTGKQKIIDTAGRVDRFNQKFAGFNFKMPE